jgi:hypothetical protein
MKKTITTLTLILMLSITATAKTVDRAPCKHGFLKCYVSKLYVPVIKILVKGVK